MQKKFRVVIFMVGLWCNIDQFISFVFLWYQRWNPGPYPYWAAAIPLSYIPSPQQFRLLETKSTSRILRTITENMVEMYYGIVF